MLSPKTIQPGDTVSDTDVGRIIDGLRARTLPKPEWTHGAHLCAGTALLREGGLAGAAREMPGIIRAYNEATGVPNSDSDGYHQTITLFYLRVIDGFLGDAFLGGRETESIGALASDILAAPLADCAYPLGFYARELLFSVKARREWVEPDLARMPGRKAP